MCIIIAKPNGVAFPPLEELTECEKGNRDGCGMSWIAKKNGEDKVVIRRDFKDALAMHNFCNTIDVATPAILHFRFATQGLKDEGGRHPYPITNNADFIRKPIVACNFAVAHNGTIGGMDGDKKFSDTQIFVMKFLASPSIYRNIEDPVIQKLIEKYVGYGKLALMTATGKLITLGDFTKDNDRLYSNSGYKATKATYYVSRGGNSPCDIYGDYYSYEGRHWDMKLQRYVYDDKEEDDMAAKGSKVHGNNCKVDSKKKERSNFKKFMASKGAKTNKELWDDGDHKHFDTNAMCSCCDKFSYSCDEFINTANTRCFYICQDCAMQMREFIPKKFNGLISNLLRLSLLEKETTKCQSTGGQDKGVSTSDSSAKKVESNTKTNEELSLPTKH